VPVLVVGNVMVGGAGKTPITIALVQKLGQMGWRVGVISRGHRRQAQEAMLVQVHSLPSQVGDEPLLIHRKTQVPVAVCGRRVEAARLLLQAHPQVNLIISDDGMQHMALAPDLVWCVLDPRRLGNGWVLPAGPLREPWPLRGQARPPTWLLSTEHPPWPNAWPVSRHLSELAVNGHGQSCRWLDLASPVAALAAIAQPEVFFQSLRERGLTLSATLALPDHDGLQDWHPGEGLTWLCTEKDAVKLWSRHPQVWAVPLCVDLPEALWTELNPFLQARLSSRHGSEIT
jgi:tetraacyldisaccharide 4'-kinase